MLQNKQAILNTPVNKTTHLRYIYKVLLCVCLCCLSITLIAQENPELDSLQALLSKATSTPNKVDLLNDIAWEFKVSDPDEARANLKAAISLSQELDYKKGEGQAFNNLGVVEIINDNPTLAIQHFQTALGIRQSIGDEKGVASLYNNIGNLYAEQDSFTLAFENLHESLLIRETLNDTSKLARVHYNLADAHENDGNYTEALDHLFRYRELSLQLDDQYSVLNAYNLTGNIKIELEQFEEAGENYQQAMELAEKLKDEWEIAITYNNMANYKDDVAEKNYKKGNFNAALPMFLESIQLHEKALALRKKLEDEDGIGSTYNNLGVVYKNFGSYYDELEQKDSVDICYQLALDYLDRSLSIRKEKDDKRGMIEVYNGIGDVKRRQNKLKEALAYTELYYAGAEEMGDDKFIQKAYKDLSKVYGMLGDYKNAYHFRSEYDEMRYRRLDEQRTRQNSRREALFGDYKKQREIERKEAALERASIQRRALMGGGIALLLLAGLLFNRNRIKNKANQALEVKNKIIESERQRSEELLLNILPESTAKELKAHGKTKARSYEAVTVLFTDFKSFTQATETMSAEILVNLLDHCYRAFDEIIHKHGIEKIKTIGDAYMCAGGLPEPNTTHALNVINAALEMQHFMRQLNKERAAQGQSVLPMRVGIHTGPVVAGVVGSKKFAYDIWGDAVNLAARMESSGEINRVNISEATYALVKDHFVCQHRGKIAAKNKGDVDMYFVEKAAKDLAEA